MATDLGSVPDDVWMSLDFIPPDEGADWRGAVDLGLMECPYGPSYEYNLTDTGHALVVQRDEIAVALFDDDGVLTTLGRSIQRKYRDTLRHARLRDAKREDSSSGRE